LAAITFLICSHQAPPSLDAAIESIARQENLASVEIVVVNNGFAAQRASELLARWPGLNLRFVDEPRPGLGFARRTGFAAATGDFLVLLDDDNTIGPGFVPQLLETIAGDAELGAVIPRIEPVWQTPPAQWVVDFGGKCLSYNAAGAFRVTYADGQYWPAGTATISIRSPGGGMIIRRDVARHYLENVNDPRRISLARRPDSLVGCEDEDVFRGVVQLRLAVRYNPGLSAYHHIPDSRTTLNYLLRLNLQMCYSYGLLYGYVKPQAAFSYRMEAGRIFRNGGAVVRDAMLRRTPVPQAILDLSREIGWSAGRWRFARERKQAA
jgi:glycosyltransferase involved in cell wall biosynthesis